MKLIDSFKNFINIQKNQKVISEKEKKEIAEINKKICKHKKINTTYMGWHKMAEEKTKKGEKQKQCKKCQLWFFKGEI